MDIKHDIDETGGEFFVEFEGERSAELAYRIDKRKLSIDHTFVDESLKGKGVGKQLVAAAVKYAREKGAKVETVCSFASAIFDRTEEYKDIRY